MLLAVIALDNLMSFVHTVAAAEANFGDEMAGRYS